jgi:hypothetical protein
MQTEDCRTFPCTTWCFQEGFLSHETLICGSRLTRLNKCPGTCVGNLVGATNIAMLARCRTPCERRARIGRDGVSGA